MGFILDSSDYPGHVKDFSGSLLANHLLCDGSVVSRSLYPNLNAIAAAAGYPWGNGDGSTTFQLPDFRRRVSIGSGGSPASGSGVSGNTVGSSGGEETHQLTSSESGMPGHQHAMSDQTWTNYVRTNGNEGNLSNGIGGFNCTTNTPGGGSRGTQFDQAAPAQNASNAHNVMQPTAIVTKQIRY